MANQLYNSLFGGNGTAQQPMNQTVQPQQPAMSMQDAMGQLRANPAQFIRQSGFQVPDELANNPQAAAMHLIQTGQVKGPVMQRIQPMLNMLMGRR